MGHDENICPSSPDPCLGRNICERNRLCVRAHHSAGLLIGEDYTPLVHFVGFRGEEYHNAVRAFGLPDVVHRVWDCRAQREIAAADTVVFAKGDDTWEPSQYNYDDSNEDDDPANWERKLK